MVGHHLIRGHMSDPNEVKINPSIDTHGLSEKDYMESITAWRDAVMDRTDEAYLSEGLRSLPEDEMSTIAQEAFDNFIQQLQVPQEPIFIGTPRRRSFLDVFTNAPIEMPEHQIAWHQRVDDPDNIDSNINEI